MGKKLIIFIAFLCCCFGGLVLYRNNLLAAGNLRMKASDTYESEKPGNENEWFPSSSVFYQNDKLEEKMLEWTKLNINNEWSEMGEIADIIAGESFYIAMCKDGSLWSWGTSLQGMLGQGELSDIQKPTRINSLDKIRKIFKNGECIYALSEDGYIWGWGSNQYHNISFLLTDKNEIISVPSKLYGLSDIKDLDSKNNKSFACDSAGSLYCWGLVYPEGMTFTGYIDGYGEVTNYPSTTKQFDDLGIKVSNVICGSGNFNYIISESGMIYTILEDTEIMHEYPDGYIFPGIQENMDFLYPKGTKSININHDIGSLLCSPLNMEGDKLSLASDDSTLFYIDNDELGYWDSNRIKYRYNLLALARPENEWENYTGIFKKIDIPEVLEIEQQDIKVIKMVSGKENVLFLCSNGDVFISTYKYTEVKDVEYYILNTYAMRTVRTNTIKDFKISDISFLKLDVSDIVNISSDGEYSFLCLSDKGEYWVIDPKDGSVIKSRKR